MIFQDSPITHLKEVGSNYLYILFIFSQAFLSLTRHLQNKYPTAKAIGVPRPL